MFASGKTSAASTGGYQISRSLRFNSADTATLARTPASAGNRKTWTWSAWVKRVTFGTTQIFFVAGVDGSNYTNLYFSGSVTDNLEIYNYTGGVTVGYHYTTSVFRDPSAWYHIVYSVDTTQAAFADRVKIYVNSVLQPVTIGTTFSSSADTWIDSANQHYIGRNGPGNASQYFDGYMTEVNFIDGQALTPSSFGETNAQTGVWQPKAYSGSYGTNGFYLNFSDNSNTTAATLGKDYSGNGNNWTPNNFSVTAGAGNDSMVDSPTQYGFDTGVGGTVRGNYGTWNPLTFYSTTYPPTITNGNLDVSVPAQAGLPIALGTFVMPSGKWYWEVTITSGNAQMVGIADSTAGGANSGYTTANGWYYYSGGQKYNNNVDVAYGTSFTVGDVIGVALDIDAGTLVFYKNGASQGTAYSTGLTGKTFVAALGNGASSTAQGYTGNFGQRAFANTAPSGFKALCTQNLPTPTIGATTATQAGKFFNPVLYTGTGASLSVTGVGFQPDWTWIKLRNAVADHALYDVVRGVQKQLESNNTSVETTETNGLTAFGSDGFTVGTLGQVNGNGSTYVGWNWKANGSGSSNTAGSITSTVSANTTSGFSVVTYTGTGANATVGHGLGSIPKMMIVKRRNSADTWRVYHATIGNTRFLNLNETAAAGTASTVWNNTTPTSSVFSIGTDSAVNGSSSTYVAYCFADVEGYSKIGSYDGNGSADGPFVFCGFRPKYILFKTTAAISQPWGVVDTTRSPYNLANFNISPTYDTTENSGYAKMDILSNGFKIRETDNFMNGSGSTYIFMAFAENPFKYSLAR